MYNNVAVQVCGMHTMRSKLCSVIKTGAKSFEDINEARLLIVLPSTCILCGAGALNQRSLILVFVLLYFVWTDLNRGFPVVLVGAF